jgi:coenzyme F420-dependent glucose-6-phosphate dehydrogenase
MTWLGYSLSSEESSPFDLIESAQAAESAGFGFSLISDHFHPWTNEQPHSPFVWSVIGGISQATRSLHVGTGVTCPLMRINPALVAQASATAAVMMKERFFLGVGSGEYLNEHITGRHWPPPRERLEMLEEAISVIRLLWKGGWQSHRGKYFVVQQARLFTLPKQTPRIMVAASKPGAAELAGRCGDGLISFEPDRALTKRFEESGGSGKPRYGQVTVCYASTKQRAAEIVRQHWPNAGVGGDLMTDLALPTHFDQAIKLIRPETITESVTLGPKPEDHLTAIKRFIDAGFDHVYVHQVGPEQRDFFRFYADNILPRFNGSSSAP